MPALVGLTKLPLNLVACAGTSLGDPIEVGALAAALVERRPASWAAPLSLLAAKSWSGHAEPGAGTALHPMFRGYCF